MCATTNMMCLVVKGLSGGTTVSGTMVAAQRAGIPVFVTGGIGGVHRGAETSEYICLSVSGHMHIEILATPTFAHWPHPRLHIGYTHVYTLATPTFAHWLHPRLHIGHTHIFGLFLSVVFNPSSCIGCF